MDIEILNTFQLLSAKPVVYLVSHLKKTFLLTFLSCHCACCKWNFVEPFFDDIYSLQRMLSLHIPCMLLHYMK